MLHAAAAPVFVLSRAGKSDAIRRHGLGAVAALVLAVVLAPCVVWAAGCDDRIPPITAGYGADGGDAVEHQSVSNPAFRRKPVEVFLPRGASGPRPVIFFAHGYGPGDWHHYQALIDNLVSRGAVLVYSSYPALLSSQERRYDSLWQGFEAAVSRFGARMDLSRVGFLGHSFGGGAVPVLAYRGLVGLGWGSHGTFIAALAPWYAYQITTPQLQRLPAHTLELMEVYQDDDINDHRMAIDLYDSSTLAARYFFMVRSQTVDGCKLTADHATPARNPSLRQKQYGVFRPLDALADAAFGDSRAARQALSALGHGQGDSVVYQPLKAETPPAPVQPQSHYRFAWDGARNPRRRTGFP